MYVGLTAVSRHSQHQHVSKDLLPGCRAQILAKKVSARAFKVVPGKQGEAAGEIGIEGTTIEAPTEVRFLHLQVLHKLDTLAHIMSA